jgi:hypothetical protein
MAMDLLQAGVDRSVIALWLGHEHVETTQIYLEATLSMKQKALAKTATRSGISRPNRQRLSRRARLDDRADHPFLSHWRPLLLFALRRGATASAGNAVKASLTRS